MQHLNNSARMVANLDFYHQAVHHMCNKYNRWRNVSSPDILVMSCVISQSRRPLRALWLRVGAFRHPRIRLGHFSFRFDNRRAHLTGRRLHPHTSNRLNEDHSHAFSPWLGPVSAASRLPVVNSNVISLTLSLGQHL